MLFEGRCSPPPHPTPVGYQVKHPHNRCTVGFQGLFVALVTKNSPAALAGLRFGDQILAINGQTMAGWDNDKAHNFIKKLDPQRITMAVRDRYVCQSQLNSGDYDLQLLVQWNRPLSDNPLFS